MTAQPVTHAHHDDPAIAARNATQRNATTHARRFDDLAIAVTRLAVDLGTDMALQPLERFFLYFPLHHSERLGQHG